MLKPISFGKNIINKHIESLVFNIMTIERIPRQYIHKPGK